ncbi:hypothetical protein ACUJ8H_37895 [Streptomyces sp. EKR5.2]|uniref:hypothetical protein n=1 Tax=Streptomyces sp. EKR5.2 TaxID=3461014 RepID=UPI004042D33A
MGVDAVVLEQLVHVHGVLRSVPEVAGPSLRRNIEQVNDPSRLDLFHFARRVVFEQAAQP